MAPHTSTSARAAHIRAHHNPAAEPQRYVPDVPRECIPRHIAIIMDGNGRWATQRGFARAFGHRAGAAAVRTAIESCYKLGVEVLTLYSFSLENWKRPPDEVEALMQLCIMYLEGEAQAMHDRKIRLCVIGQREGLPPPVLEVMDRVSALTAKNDAMTLCLAINYGSRTEIVSAAASIARDVAAGTLQASQVDEAELTRRLWTRDLPDPDLLIRTAGELRVSNFLLWQISYAEFYATPTLWPDFCESDLHAAIRDYARRSRRFGGLDPGSPPSDDA
jgi:undecaprenyl diphosphate synthase